MTSPRYVAKVSRKVKAQIATWRLPREQLISVYTHLVTELPAAPDRHLFEPISRPNLWMYRVILGQPPQRWVFSFAVERRDYVGELHVLKAHRAIEGS